MQKKQPVRFTIRISQKDNFLLEEVISSRKVPISKQRFILEAIHAKLDESNRQKSHQNSTTLKRESKNIFIKNY